MNTPGSRTRDDQAVHDPAPPSDRTDIRRWTARGAHWGSVANVIAEGTLRIRQSYSPTGPSTASRCPRSDRRGHPLRQVDHREHPARLRVPDARRTSDHHRPQPRRGRALVAHLLQGPGLHPPGRTDGDPALGAEGDAGTAAIRRSLQRTRTGGLTILPTKPGPPSAASPSPPAASSH